MSGAAAALLLPAPADRRRRRRPATTTATKTTTSTTTNARPSPGGSPAAESSSPSGGGGGGGGGGEWDPVSQTYRDGIVPSRHGSAVEACDLLSLNGDGRLRVFGYGSLCWHPGSEGVLSLSSSSSSSKGRGKVTSSRGRAVGYARRWCQRSADHRGTTMFNGIVCTLLSDGEIGALLEEDVRPGRRRARAGRRCSTTEGVIYTIDGDLAEECLAELDFRERGVSLFSGWWVPPRRRAGAMRGSSSSSCRRFNFDDVTESSATILLMASRERCLQCAICGLRDSVYGICSAGGGGGGGCAHYIYHLTTRMLFAPLAFFSSRRPMINDRGMRGT